MCFLEYVCVCVWALLCLQDAQRRTGSLKSFGYKVKRARREMETKRREQERERDRREKKGTRHNNIHKGRAGSAKCGQQSLYLCDADSPLFIPTFRGGNRGEGEKVFTLTRMWHLSSQSFLFNFFPPLTLLLNNTLEWRTILLLPPPPPQLCLHSRFM